MLGYAFPSILGNLMSKIYQMDAVDWLKTLENCSVDLFITDPPYESLEKYRQIGTTTRLKESKSSSNQWFSVFPNTRFEELFREVYRVLKKVLISIYFATRKLCFGETNSGKCRL